jgi:predicted RND superfamily exporter protein
MFTARDRKLSLVILTLTLLLTVWGGWRVTKVRFDYDFTRFFPPDDSVTLSYERFREYFGSEENYILLGWETERGIFNASFLQKLERFTEKLQALPYVRSVGSPTNLSYLYLDPLLGIPTEQAYLTTDGSSSWEDDSLRIFASPDLIGSYFSPDGKSISILLQHEEALNDSACARLNDAIMDLIDEEGWEGIHVAGRCTGQTYYVRMMQEEVVLFLGISMILIVSFLFIAFRSFWGIWVPLYIVGLAVVLLLALMETWGKPLNIISNVIPSVLLVVCLSAVVHILSKYLDELRKGAEQRQALIDSLRLIGKANVLTTLTTAIGFLTLTTSPVRPMAEFGLFMALGVAIGLGLAYTVLPALLIWLPMPQLTQKKQETGFWHQYLHASFLWILRHRKAMLLGSVGLVLLCLGGLSKLEVNNRMIEDLKSENPVLQAAVFYEEKFVGARPFEMELCLVDDSQEFFSLSTLQKVDSIENWLQEYYEVGFMISPLTYLKYLNRARSGADPSAFVLPPTERALRRNLRLLDRMGTKSDWPQWFVENPSCFRISGKMPDLGSKIIRGRDQELVHFMAGFPEFRYQVTGTGVLIDRNNQLVANNILLGLMIAFGAIALLAGLIFRSARMVLITLLPNVLPLLIIGAVMGYVGVSIKLSTSIVFTIAFGIAVDDTIHFLTRFHTEVQRMPWLWALRRSFLSTGKAIIVTTLILSGGFLALTFSDFMGTFLIGLLVSLTLLSALIADLIFLPVLLVLFYPDSVTTFSSSSSSSSSSNSNSSSK